MNCKECNDTGKVTVEYPLEMCCGVRNYLGECCGLFIDTGTTTKEEYACECQKNQSGSGRQN